MKRNLILLAAASLLLISCGASRQNSRHIIGFYNVENLFDVTHDEGKNDYEYLPDGANQWTEEKYAVKLRNMADAIDRMHQENGMWHTVLGLAEVENRHVVEDLVNQPLLAEANYQIVHYESPDRRGVDVALLYDPSRMTYVESEALPYDFNTSIPITTYTPEEQADFRTRDALMVHGIIEGEHFAFYVCHLPSRLGSKGGDLRARGAEIIYEHAQKMAQKYPGIKCVVMGDMNDNPADESMSVYLHARRNIQEVGKGDFFSPFWSMLDAGIGSLYYRGDPNIFDCILVNDALVNAPKKTFRLQVLDKEHQFYGRVFNAPFLTQQDGPYAGTPFRTFSNGEFVAGYSDHYPTFIEIRK